MICRNKSIPESKRALEAGIPVLRIDRIEDIIIAENSALFEIEIEFYFMRCAEIEIFGTDLMLKSKINSANIVELPEIQRNTR